MKSLPLNYALLFLLLVTLSARGLAQISFDNPLLINSKSGLPADEVASILKDDQGFIWFATSNGLCRWDGVFIKTFEHSPADSNTISGNMIARNAFYWDSATKQIIIGTENGLSFFDPHKLTFKNFIGNNNKSLAFLSGIHAVSIDRQNELWLGTELGLVRFQRDSSSFQTYYYLTDLQQQQHPDQKRVNHIQDVKQDIRNDSILWLATLEGLVKFNKYTEKFNWFYFDQKKYKIDLNAFTKIIAHPNRRLYLGTWNADMVVFSTIDEQFEFSCGPFTSEKDCYFSPILPCAVKSVNELWISSREGIGIFNTVTNKIRILKSFKNPEGRGFTPYIVFIDDKTMWLASEYGAFLYRLSGQYFNNYFFPPVDEDHWFLTSSFYEDTIHKKLYIGYARGQGLHYFDLKTHSFHFIPISKRLLNEAIVREILLVDENNLLILCPDEVYKFSISHQRVTPLRVTYADYPSFTDIAYDNKGSIWLSSSNSGLQQLDLATGDLRNINKVKTYFDQNRAVPTIYEIVIDKRNRIWFRDDESYGYYIPGEDSLRYFTSDQRMNLSSFYQEKDSDTVWVGTSGKGLGFILASQAEEGVQIYNSTIKGNIISLQRDPSGNFFLLTSAGIEKLSTGKKQTVIYNEHEGLIKFEKWENRDPTLPGKLFKLSDGRMVIGYRRGLGFFYPDSLHKTDEDFAPYISSLYIFDKEILPEKELFQSKDLELAYNQNFLSFEYSALAVGNGNDILLSHKLTGIDKDWVSSGQRNVNYSNLQSGTYQFIVKAESKSIPDLVRKATLNIIIHPPWWKTWWAILLFILIFLSFVYSIYCYQLSRVLAHKEAARLKELNSLKSRLYANITHEFRTPLTVIKGMTDDMIEDMNKEEQKRFADKLKMIDRNSDKLLHLVKQMLDMSKIEDGKMKMNLIRDNIVSYLQYVLESFQSMADAKNVKLVFYHETDEVVMDYDQDKIFVIASNLLSNAIKFTPKSGKVIFHVKKETEGDKNHLVIKVQDSGIGIEKEHLSHIFDRFYQVDNSLTRKGEGTGIGLALTKELVVLMNGEITVKSTPNAITEFRVSLPITRKAPLEKSRAIKMQPGDEQERTVDLITEEGSKDLPLALVVEDNADVAKYIISCLAGKYRVKWSPDGKQGIEAAVIAIPDIIISDVMMPEKDGFEVCETLKQDERTSHIPIVLLTAKATDTDRIEGLSHGADAYLTKPFNKKELFVRLEQLIKIRRQLQEKYSKVEISLVEKAEPTGEERFLKKAIEIIEKNLDNPELDAGLLASDLYLSESQLYRKLKALSGKSTSLFIRGIRLSAAKILLETSELNISETAYQCGFSNPAWFSRAFKEEFGVSPSAFRK